MHPPTEKASGRTSTLLYAKILWAEGEAKARVRNISEMGALLESDANLPPKESILLQREGLEVNGHVVWAKDNTYGIKFLSTIDPTVWIGGPTSKAALVASSSLKQLLEEDKDVSSLIELRLSEEVAYSARLLENVGEAFSKDAVLCNRYPTQLQNMSIAIQMLTEISAVMRASDKLNEVESKVTGPMKARILR